MGRYRATVFLEWQNEGHTFQNFKSQIHYLLDQNSALNTANCWQKIFRKYLFLKEVKILRINTNLLYRFHLKSWQQWCTRNQDVKLMVKHKSEGSSRPESQIKTFWNFGQDNNNNGPSHNNPFTAWLFPSYTNNDLSCSLQQQTTAV